MQGKIIRSSGRFSKSQKISLWLNVIKRVPRETKETEATLILLQINTTYQVIT